MSKRNFATVLLAATQSSDRLCSQTVTPSLSMMKVSVARVFLKPIDTGKEPSVHVLFEPPATVGLGPCFRLLIMSFTTLSSLRSIARVQTMVSSPPRIGLHSYCCDSHGKLAWMELNTFKPWLVRPAIGSFRSAGARKATARHMSGSPAATERQDADDPNRLTGRCRSELQAPPLDSVLTVCLIDQYLDRRPVPQDSCSWWRWLREV